MDFDETSFTKLHLSNDIKIALDIFLAFFVNFTALGYCLIDRKNCFCFISDELTPIFTHQTYPFSVHVLLLSSGGVLCSVCHAFVFCFFIAPACSRVQYRHPLFRPSVCQHLCRHSTFMLKLVF